MAVTLFSDLLTEYIGLAYLKQTAFNEYLGDHSWQIDTASGTVNFGGDRVFPIQMLGTEAEVDSSWLWSWANEKSDLAPSMVEYAMDMRDFGVGHGISEFSECGFSIEVANGHTLSMVASGMFPECAYYRGPFQGGALYFLVQNLPESIRSNAPVSRVISTITEVIAEFPVLHAPMCDCLLRSQRFSVDYEDTEVSATRGDDIIKLTFNERMFLSAVDGRIT